jgi:hypothetical protein
MQFLVNVYDRFKFRTSLFKNGIWFPFRNFRHLPLFTARSSRKNCPSARPILCAKMLTLSKHLVLFKHIPQ